MPPMGLYATLSKFIPLEAKRAILRRGRSEAEMYWHKRQHMLYYQAVKALVVDLGKGATSAVDVGSAGCPFLDWLPHAAVRTSVDWGTPYRGPGVTPVKADFLTWEPDRRYDIVTCLQVLEHIPDAKAFAQKLLAIGDTVIISVPYKWEPGRVRTHVQDPVDEEKVLSWFGREPNFSYICREVKNDSERLIHVYDGTSAHWKSLADRDLQSVTPSSR